jgi:hypothetical protein
MDTTSDGRTHWLDTAFAWLAARRPMFQGGWGDETLLASVQHGPLFGPPPGPAAPRWRAPRERRGLLVRDGTFLSPLAGLPGAVSTAHVRWLSGQDGPARSVCLVLAGSREEGFALREAVLEPLVRTGIDLLLLENPFYGLRRAPGQRGATVRTVSEHILLNLGMVQEARALLGWLGGVGYAHRAVTGYSMGGFMAALVAALTPEPLAVAALAAGTTPAPVFTRGLLSRSVDFLSLGASSGGPEHARERLASLFGRADAQRLPAPVRPDAAVVVGCTADGYVSGGDTRALHAHWPGSVLRWVNAGHVSALFTRRAELRAAVADALGKLAWPPGVATG